MSKIYPVYVFNIYVKSYTTKLPTLPQTIKYKFRLQTNRSKTSKIQTLSMLRFIKINIISNKTICITGLTLQVLSYNYVRKHTTNRQLMIFLKPNKSFFSTNFGHMCTLFISRHAHCHYWSPIANQMNKRRKNKIFPIKMKINGCSLIYIEAEKVGGIKAVSVEN